MQTRNRQVGPLGIRQPDGTFKPLTLDDIGLPPGGGGPASGLIPSGIDADGVPIVTVKSPYGIGSDGIPYYSDTGAVPGEEALLSLDPLTGKPVLTKVEL